MKAFRVTDASVEEIIKALDNRIALRYPTCLLINELGIIIVNQDDDCDEAEKALISELKKTVDRRWIAIRHLCTLSKLGLASPETLDAINEFKTNPENSTFFPSDEEIDDVIIDMRAKHCSMN